MKTKPPLLKIIRRTLAPLARPTILFYAMPWFMILVALGTVTQKDMGLYPATEKYINSFILWLGPIPTPGGLTLIALIFLTLSIKFIFFSKWNWRQSGIILTHLGVLLLLLGGLLTASLNREGFMAIVEGDSMAQFADYKKKVVNFTAQDGALVKTLPFEDLSIGQEIKVKDITLKILDICENCDAQAPSGKYENLRGLAVNMELIHKPSELNIEANFSGITFEVVDAPLEDDKGVYIIMADITKTPELTSQGGLILSPFLGRAETPLPFTVKLVDFRKINYPGTLKAKEYESDLIIQDGDIEWPVKVSMNKPLRYKGYSFYQSSFEQRPDIEVSVLNIVQNKGRIFPYISTLIIFAGLLVHIIVRIQTSRQKRQRAA